MPSTLDQYGAPLSALFEAFATRKERELYNVARTNGLRWYASKSMVRRLEKSRIGKVRLLAFGQGYAAAWTLARSGV